MDGEDAPSYALPQRERLRSRVLRITGEVGSALRQEGRWRPAESLYRKALEIDPLAERLNQGLMQVYDELGQCAELKRTYRRCCDMLHRVLGTEPSEQTHRLYRARAR